MNMLSASLLYFLVYTLSTATLGCLSAAEVALPSSSVLKRSLSPSSPSSLSSSSSSSFLLAKGLAPVLVAEENENKGFEPNREFDVDENKEFEPAENKEFEPAENKELPVGPCENNEELENRFDAPVFENNLGASVALSDDFASALSPFRFPNKPVDVSFVLPKSDGASFFSSLLSSEDDELSFSSEFDSLFSDSSIENSSSGSSGSGRFSFSRFVFFRSSQD